MSNGWVVRFTTEPETLAQSFRRPSRQSCLDLPRSRPYNSRAQQSGIGKAFDDVDSQQSASVASAAAKASATPAAIDCQRYESRTNCG